MPTGFFVGFEKTQIPVVDELGFQWIGGAMIWPFYPICYGCGDICMMDKLCIRSDMYFKVIHPKYYVL